MAGRIEKMLQPGERVVFRTEPRRRVWMGWVMLVWLAGAGLGVAALGVFPGISFRAATLLASFGIIVTPLIGLVASIAVRGNGGAALVTDRRILFLPGTWAIRVVEVQLANLEHVFRFDWHVSFWDRTDRWVACVPDPDGLHAAITAAGVPAYVPQPHRLADWFFLVGCIAPMAGGASAALIACGTYFGLVAGNDSWDADLGIIALTPVWVAAALLGTTLGLSAAVLQMRRKLPAADAREVFDLELTGSGDGYIERANAALVLRPLRRLASLLYGEQI